MFPTEIIIVPAIFIGLPWLILHYVTKWKTAATITTDDEALLEDLYQLARRLEERMDTVERLVAADNPGFRAARLGHERDAAAETVARIDSIRASQGSKTSKEGSKTR